jgi:hypothetical protein
MTQHRLPLTYDVESDGVLFTVAFNIVHHTPPLLIQGQFNELFAHTTTTCVVSTTVAGSGRINSEGVAYCSTTEPHYNPIKGCRIALDRALVSIGTGTEEGTTSDRTRAFHTAVMPQVAKRLAAQPTRIGMKALRRQIAHLDATLSMIQNLTTVGAKTTVRLILADVVRQTEVEQSK